MSALNAHSQVCNKASQDPQTLVPGRKHSKTLKPYLNPKTQNPTVCGVSDLLFHMQLLLYAAQLVVEIFVHQQLAITALLRGLRMVQGARWERGPSHQLGSGSPL